MRIKSILLVICAFLLVGSLQTEAQIRLGVRGGINISGISFSGDKSNLSHEKRTGFSFGPVLDTKIPFSSLGIEVAALYSHSYLDGVFTKTILKSIEIPLHLKWSANMLQVFGVYAIIGPQFGFNVGKRDDSFFSLRERHASLNIGGGFIILNHLQLGVNYNFAITRTATLQIPVEASSTHYAAKIKNNSWQAAVTYLF